MTRHGDDRRSNCVSWIFQIWSVQPVNCTTGCGSKSAGSLVPGSGLCIAAQAFAQQSLSHQQAVLAWLRMASHHLRVAKSVSCRSHKACDYHICLMDFNNRTIGTMRNADSIGRVSMISHCCQFGMVSPMLKPCVLPALSVSNISMTKKLMLA